MKLAVAIADDKAGPSAFVVWRGFEQSIAKAAAYGYHGVELALRTRQDVDEEGLRQLLKQHQMEVSCISTGQVFADLGLYLTAQDKETRKQAVEVLRGLVQMAAEFGQMVNLGRARGFVGEGQTMKQAEAIFIDSLGQLLPDAKANGVTIVIEPVNRYEINFINSVEQCAQLIASINSDRIGIMPDVFHMNIEDVQIGGALEKYAHLVRYVHLADSNRMAPGWGHLDFDEVFSALGRGGYGGWVTAEILPLPSADEGARQAASYLLPRVERYNASHAKA